MLPVLDQAWQPTTNTSQCEKHMIQDMPFLCTPLALDNNSKFNYSLAFVISPWIFFFVEFCLSEHLEASVSVSRSSNIKLKPIKKKSPLLKVFCSSGSQPKKKPTWPMVTRLFETSDFKPSKRHKLDTSLANLDAIFEVC